MAHAIHARLDARFGVDRPSAADDASIPASDALPGDIRLSVHEDLSAVEPDWRDFERRADGTVFQSFDWLATWQRHIGTLASVRPAIVVGRNAGGILFMLPLATRAVGFARELIWLGSDLCDYNAPLLAQRFSERFDRAGFTALWAGITDCLQRNARHRYDVVNLTKMPAMVGSQPNPMLHLGVTVNPSGAYLTHLAGDWETFYAAKRSSTTRRRDRTKRKRLSDFGEVRLVNPESAADILSALDLLMVQKARLFSHMGVGNLFARPGHAEFYRALASEPATRPLVHVSRLDVGAAAAAVNLGLTYRDCYYHLLASYDDGDLSRFGPGAAHLHDLLHQAIDRGFKVFDFTIGDERYKRDWCDSEIKLHDHISAATWRGALIAMPRLAGQRLKRWIKQTPILWSVFSTARALAGSLTRRNAKDD
jgi:CelD/BcsL family acetyltransferase involved in cellulose biosynthesis